MEALYHETSQLIQETSNYFYKLENNPDPIKAEEEIQFKLNAINKNCEKLDVLVYKTPINQRPMAKMRVDQLKYDSKHIQASLHNAQNKRLRREQEKSEREQLLSRRFGHDHTEITVDYNAQANMSLQNSHRGVDEMLHTDFISRSQYVGRNGGGGLVTRLPGFYIIQSSGRGRTTVTTCALVLSGLFWWWCFLY